MSVSFCNQSRQMTLVSGNVPGDLGVYQQCAQLSHAQYCTLFSTVPFAYNSVMGFCLPATCTLPSIAEYVAQNPALNSSYQYLPLLNSSLMTSYVVCSTVMQSPESSSSSSSMTSHDLIMIVVLGIWIALLCVATAYDYVVGVTLSSEPWQRVLRNSDGNIVHVVQPPTLVDRRTWRAAKMSLGSSSGAGPGNTRRRADLSSEGGAAPVLPPRSRGRPGTRSWIKTVHNFRHSAMAGGAATSRAGTPSGPPAATTAPPVSLFDSVPLAEEQESLLERSADAAGSSSSTTSSLHRPTRNESPTSSRRMMSTATGASGDIQQHLREERHLSLLGKPVVVAVDCSAQPNNYGTVTEADTMVVPREGYQPPDVTSPFLDRPAPAAALLHRLSPPTPGASLRRAQHEDDNDDGTVAGRPRRVDSTGSSGNHSPRATAVSAGSPDSGVEREGSVKLRGHSRKSSSVAASRRGSSSSSGSDGSAEGLGETVLMTLRGSIRSRVEQLLGEERLSSLRERHEQLKQFMAENLPDLSDLPDLPNFQSVVFRCVLCLSLMNSFRKWRYYPTTQANVNIFNSVRVLAWLWIVSVDTFEYTRHVPTFTNGADMSDNPLYALVQRQGSSAFAIGTFLAISGFTTMHRLKTSEERPMSAAAIVMANSETRFQKALGYVSWYVKYFISRFVRVVPLYAATLFLLQPLLIRAGDGPFWHTFARSPFIGVNCRTQWWTNLLFLNNFLPADTSQRCFPWSYYVALELQLVLFAPVIHFYYKRVGYKWFLPTALAASVASMALRYFMATPCEPFRRPPSWNYYDPGTIFEGPQYMMMPFVAGVSLYYAFSAVTLRQENIKLLGQEASMILLRHEADSKSLDLADRASFWLLFKLRSKPFRVLSIWSGVCLLVACIVGSWALQRSEDGCRESVGVRLFSAVSLFAWCVGLCLIILPMLFGFGGNMRRFLIHRLWCGASRLVFAAYLVHPLVISFCNASKYYPASMEFLLFLVDSWGNAVVSLIVAFLFHLGVEQPSMHLTST